MGNVWNNCFNLIFQNDTTIEFQLDVQEDCRAHRVLQNRLKIFLAWYRPKMLNS